MEAFMFTQERERLEREKRDMQTKLETEIVELQHNMQKLQKMEKLFAQESGRDNRVDSLREKMQVWVMSGV